MTGGHKGEHGNSQLLLEYLPLYTIGESFLFLFFFFYKSNPFLAGKVAAGCDIRFRFHDPVPLFPARKKERNG